MTPTERCEAEIAALEAACYGEDSLALYLLGWADWHKEKRLIQEEQYRTFLDGKLNDGSQDGFAPIFMPEFLFDFQKLLVDWSLRKGKSAIFADCGLGKTPIQLVWAENIVRKIARPRLLSRWMKNKFLRKTCCNPVCG